jgi:hypothetical protein
LADRKIEIPSSVLVDALIEKLENEIYYLNDTERATSITPIMFFHMLLT